MQLETKEEVIKVIEHKLKLTDKELNMLDDILYLVTSYCTLFPSSVNREVLLKFAKELKSKTTKVANPSAKY